MVMLNSKGVWRQRDWGVDVVVCMYLLESAWCNGSGWGRCILNGKSWWADGGAAVASIPGAASGSRQSSAGRLNSCHKLLQHDI